MGKEATGTGCALFLGRTFRVAMPPQPGCGGWWAAGFWGEPVARPMLIPVCMSRAPKARLASAAKKPLMILCAALALVFTVTAGAGDAEARGWRRHHHRGWLGFGGGFRAWFFAPPIWFHYHRYETPPPPPVYAPPPPPAYAYPYAPPPAYTPPPPPAYAPPPPPQVYAIPQRDRPHIGLMVAGLVEAPQTGQLPMGGVAAGLQFRTGSHTLLSLELQSLGAHRLSDDARRTDLAGIVSGRFFLWNAGIAPYLELGGGLGRASLSTRTLPDIEAAQMLGRFGVGLELRLGEHLVLDGQIAQTHKLMFDDAVEEVDAHERATQFRGGVTLRF